MLVNLDFSSDLAFSFAKLGALNYEGRDIRRYFIFVCNRVVQRYVYLLATMRIYEMWYKQNFEQWTPHADQERPVTHRSV